MHSMIRNSTSNFSIREEAAIKVLLRLQSMSKYVCGFVRWYIYELSTYERLTMV